MLLVFGNMFSSKITFWCEGLCTPQAGILWESFPLEWFQPALLLRSCWEHAASHPCSSLPGCSTLGLPGWFRELRSQHAFSSHVFSFCIFRDYTNPYFSVSRTSYYAALSLTFITEVSYLHQKYLPAPSKQMPSHHWLKLAQFSKTAFIVGSFSSRFNWANCLGGCFK